MGLKAASAQFANDHDVEIARDRRSLQAFADASIDGGRGPIMIVLDHPHVGLIAETGSLLSMELPGDSAEGSLGRSLESCVWKSRLLMSTTDDIA